MSELNKVKELVTKMFLYRKKIEMVEETLKELNGDLTKIKEEIKECLTAADLDQFDVPEVGKVYIKNIYNWKLPQGEARQAFFDYLKQNNQEDMLTVNHNTFNSFCKKKLEEAQERGEISLDIPGVEEPTLFQTVSMRKA